MARIVQGTISAGFGGLEMVVQDFHAWLIRNGHDASVVVLEGTALHTSLLNSGFAKSTVAISPKRESRSVRRQLLQKFDSPDTAFLFHRHQGLKSAMWTRFKAKTSMLSHTFYKSKKRDFWHRFLFSKADQWIALTPLHKQNMSEMLAVDPNKIIIIPNGVDLNKFKPSLHFDENKDVLHIAMVARLDPQKGQDIAIEALALLKKATRKKVFLHFFGGETPVESSIRPYLVELKKKFGLEREVIFENFVPQVESVLPKMDILWLPSHRETFGRCLIEAMACGVPIVASDAGGVPDIIQHKINGMLFETKNAEDLMRKTLLLIENPLLRKKMRNEGLRTVRENYDIDQVFTRLLKAILPEQVSTQQLAPETLNKNDRNTYELFRTEASFGLSAIPK